MTYLPRTTLIILKIGALNFCFVVWTAFEGIFLYFHIWMYKYTSWNWLFLVLYSGLSILWLEIFHNSKWYKDVYMYNGINFTVYITIYYYILVCLILVLLLYLSKNNCNKKIITESLYYYFSNNMTMCCFNCHFVIYIIFIVVYLPLILSFTMIFSEP